MSTRANIIIKDRWNKLYFYRHCDGYPDRVMPSLEKFMQCVKDGKIRDNVGQAAGWLIVMGYHEYGRTEPQKDISGWKVGAYEPATGIHVDIEYLYVVDLEKKSIEIIEDGFDEY